MGIHYLQEGGGSNIGVDHNMLSHSDKVMKFSFLLCGRRHTPSLLKLPSLFAARLIWPFHNKLHNMKALVILSHHDHHFFHLLVFMKKMNFCGSLWGLLEYFREKKLPTDHRFNIGAHIWICALISVSRAFNSDEKHLPNYSCLI